MALKVWLPLNGNPDVVDDISNLVKSIGTSGDIVLERVGSHHSFSPGGKLGYALSFIGAASDYLYMPGLKLQTFSWACWFKCTNDSVATSQRILSEGRDTGSRGAEIWVSQSGTTLYLQAHGITHSTTVELNKWYHTAFTCGDGIFSSYLNGNLINSSTYTADCDYAQSNDKFVIGKMAYNYSNSSNYFPFIGQINDVRIYDHCLSAKEVKEISQGLILHYKLNGFSGGAGENILTGTNYNSYSSSLNATTATNANGKWCGGSGGNGTFSVIEDSTCPVGNLIWNISNNTSGNRDFQQGNQPYVSGQQYTTSFWAKGNGTCLYRSWNSTDGKQMFSKTWTLTSDWVYYTHTFTASAEMETDLCTFHLGVTGNSNISICGMKMEKGSIATAWSPAPQDFGIDTSKIVDSSGYGNDGVITGNLTTGTDGGRYNISTYFSSGNTNYITTPTLTLPGDAITMNFWFKSSNKTPGADYHMPLAAAASSNQAYEMSIHKNGYLRGGLVVAGTRKVDNCTSTKLLDGNWHMCTMTYDGATIKRYVDAVMEKSTTTTGALVTSAPFVLGHYGTNTSYYNKEAYESDVRIYATALSAEDILDLYYTPANIDNLGGIHGFEFAEDDGKSIGKNGIVHTNNICQINDLIHYCQYDNTLYFEPDGSAWMHIYHHNNPGGGSFASTDTFSTGVYKDENRWFDGTQVCNSLTQWEFLIKYKFTSTGTEYKERWIQSKNPEEAVYGDVDAADITRITTGGYKAGTWGGLYKKNNSAYWVMNNGNSGNWWGATCAFSVYQSGTPGYGGTVTTTGVNDLYVRIDNLPLSNFANASITKDGVYKGNNFIEK